MRENRAIGLVIAATFAACGVAISVVIATGKGSLGVAAQLFITALIFLTLYIGECVKPKGE